MRSSAAAAGRVEASVIVVAAAGEHEESRDDEQTAPEEERPLPHLKPGDELRALSLEPEGHATTSNSPLDFESGSSKCSTRATARRSSHPLTAAD